MQSKIPTRVAKMMEKPTEMAMIIMTYLSSTSSSSTLLSVSGNVHRQSSSSISSSSKTLLVLHGDPKETVILFQEPFGNS